MSTRPIISYEDITLPYDAPPEPSLGLPDSFTGTASAMNANATGPPPSKKRKKNKNKQRNTPSSQKAANNARISQPQSFVGPTVGDVSMTESYDATGELYEDEEGWDENEEGESRQLTHDEIWDDSALVDAWDAAMEEYEMFHGPGKDWKNEPIKKSPLWYNIPPKPSTDKSKAAYVEDVETEIAKDEADSQPLNFDTFVPTHDPTLEMPTISTQQVSGGGMSENYLPDSASGPMVSQDEAFQKALNAMYWGGYWTAMYHAQRYYTNTGATKRKSEDDIRSGEGGDVDGVEDEEEDDALEGEEDETDEFVDTQR